MSKFPDFRHINLKQLHPFLGMMGGFELEKCAQIIWDEYRKSGRTDWKYEDFEGFSERTGFDEWLSSRRYFIEIGGGVFRANDKFFETVEKKIKEHNPSYLK